MKKYKHLTLILAAAVLLLVLAGCRKDSLPAASEEPEEIVVQQTEETPASSAVSLPVNTEEAAAETGEPQEEPWKTALAEDLFEKYGVLPEYYEDLGNDIYQVYVEVGGEIVPFVTVNAITGDYHG